MAQKIIDLLVTITKDDGEEMTYTQIHPGVYQTKKTGGKKYTPDLQGLGYKVRVAEVFYKYIIAYKNNNKRSGDHVTSRVPRSDGNSDDPRPVLPQSSATLLFPLRAIGLGKSKAEALIPRLAPRLEFARKTKSDAVSLKTVSRDSFFCFFETRIEARVPEYIKSLMGGSHRPSSPTSRFMVSGTSHSNAKQQDREQYNKK
jgi:hypothetical protein